MAKYALGVNRSFVARHFLVGGDFGPEGELHPHDYRVELVLEADSLDEHGFLVDIVCVRDELHRLVDRYQERSLNELPEFDGLNPSCEAFSRVVAESLRDALDVERLSGLSVRIWESDEAWAECRLDLDSE